MQTSGIDRRRWWQWPTILSLDAPAVALLWQWEIAKTAGTSILPPRAFVLGSSVWLAYAADRWIEGWRLDPGQIRTQRHRFYQEWRWPVAAVWIAIFAADLLEAFTGLDRRELFAGFLLLACVLAYLFSHQFIHRHHPWRLPKEACVALLLCGGAGLFPLAAPAAPLEALLAPLAMFASLCFANCALISVWENEVDQSHGQTSLARQFSWGASLGRVFPIVIALAAATWAWDARGVRREAAACVLVSALLLGAVDTLHPRLGRARSRILADLVLMTPALPWLAALLR